MPTGKHFCFTLNNPTEDECLKLEKLGETKSEGLVYLICGAEVGETGTKHIQGFVSWDKRRTFAWVKRRVSPRCHLEGAKGSPKQAAAYCKKDGKYLEYGVIPAGKGSRTDLVRAVEIIKRGGTMRELAQASATSLVRYGGGLLRLRQLHRPVRESPPSIWVFWGKTGTGKTRRVWEFVDHGELWVHPGDRWFDGYDGHKAVLFDDFDGSWFKLVYLLRLLDRYPMSVPVKGAYAWWSPTSIYITSNLEPKEWYKNATEEHQRALLRRLREFGNIQKCE